MPLTTNRGWKYPVKGKKPYFVTIQSFYEEIDTDVQTLFDMTFRDIVPTIAKGGLVSDTGTATSILSVGADGYALIADSTEANGLKWTPYSGPDDIVFEASTGIGSVIRKNESNIVAGNHSITHGFSNNVLGDYCFISGYDHTIASDYCSAFGESHDFDSSSTYSSAVGYGQTLNSTTYSFLYGSGNTSTTSTHCSIGGHSNTVTDGYSSIVIGANHNTESLDRSILSGSRNTVNFTYFSNISGSSHKLLGTLSYGIYSCLVAGEGHYIGEDCKFNCVTGLDHSLDDSATSSFVSCSNNMINPILIGTTISLFYSGGTITLTDTKALFSIGLDGLIVTIADAINAGNNGSFTVTYVNSTQLTYTNASGVSESGNSDLSWSFGSSANSYVSIFGYKNAAIDGGLATIISGQNNVCSSGFSSSLLIGSNNRTLQSAGNNSIILGKYNTASQGGLNDSILFGEYNVISSGGISNSLCGGSYNAIGQLNHSIIVGSRNVFASGTSNVFSMGLKSGLSYPANHFHLMSGGHPSSSSTSAAVGQGQLYDMIPFSGETTDGAVTRLYINGTGAASLSFNTAADHAYLFVTYVIAKCTSGGSVTGVKSWRIVTTLNKVSTTLSIIGTPEITILASTSIANEWAWTVNPSIYSSTSFTMDVLGHVSDTVRWQCYTMGPEIGIS